MNRKLELDPSKTLADIQLSSDLVGHFEDASSQYKAMFVSIIKSNDGNDTACKGQQYGRTLPRRGTRGFPVIDDEE